MEFCDAVPVDDLLILRARGERRGNVAVVRETYECKISIIVGFWRFLSFSVGRVASWTVVKLTCQQAKAEVFGRLEKSGCARAIRRKSREMKDSVKGLIWSVQIDENPMRPRVQLGQRQLGE